MNIQINFRSYRFYWKPEFRPLIAGLDGRAFYWLWFNVNWWRQKDAV